MFRLSLLAVIMATHGRVSREVEHSNELDAAGHDDVADELDTYSRRLATPVAYRLVALANLRDGEYALDVGTGTGMIAFAIAHTAPPTCSIVGIDMSAGMIESARRSAETQHVPAARVAFHQMNAEALSLETASFDVVTSAFALGGIARPERAMAEMYRVLRAGGRLLITVASGPSLLTFDAVEHALDELGRRFHSLRGLRQSSDLLDRIVDRRLPADTRAPSARPATEPSLGGMIASLAHEAGFVHITQSWRNYQNEVTSPEDFWRMQCTINGRARKRLLGAPPEMIEAVRKEFLDVAADTLRRGGHLVHPISATFVTAQKPARSLGGAMIRT